LRGGGKVLERGYLIAVEGIDGAGKTVNSRWLVRRLRKSGYRAAYTKEPTEGPIGKVLRRSLARRGSNPEMDALLFAADRLHHIRTFIEPRLRQGFIVVTDRYLYSSIAYQGALTGDRRWVELINRYCVPPDLAVYLDVDPSTGLERKRRLRSSAGAFEDPEVLRRVRAVYLELCAEGKMVMIPADRELREVRAEIARVVGERLGIEIRTG